MPTREPSKPRSVWPKSALFIAVFAAAGCAPVIDFDWTLELTQESGRYRLSAIDRDSLPAALRGGLTITSGELRLHGLDFDGAPPPTFDLWLVFCTSPDPPSPCPAGSDDAAQWSGTYQLSGGALSLTPASSTRPDEGGPVSLASWTAEYLPGEVRIRVVGSGAGSVPMTASFKKTPH